MASQCLTSSCISCPANKSRQHKGTKLNGTPNNWTDCLPVSVCQSGQVCSIDGFQIPFVCLSFLRFLMPLKSIVLRFHYNKYWFPTPRRTITTSPSWPSLGCLANHCMTKAEAETDKTSWGIFSTVIWKERRREDYFGAINRLWAVNKHPALAIATGWAVSIIPRSCHIYEHWINNHWLLSICFLWSGIQCLYIPIAFKAVKCRKQFFLFISPLFNQVG